MGQVANSRFKPLEKTTDKIGSKNRTNVDCRLIPPSAYPVRERFLMMFICIPIIVSLMITMGCYTTDTSQTPYKKEYSKYINDMAILFYAENPEMDVNIRNDEMFISRLVAGPVIISQLFMLLAHNSANLEDNIALNEIIFDLNIGEVLCEKLNTKFQLCSYFHVVPQKNVTKNKVVWKLMEKKDKDPKDYEKIGNELEVDTILEIGIISYGIKDPGIFSDPYAFLKIDAKMTTASEGTVIWRDIVQAKTAVGMKTQDFLDFVYTVPDFLKKQLEEVTDVVSERCIEKLGFDTNYTYLLEEDYIKKTEHKINIAEKLNKLNDLRHEGLITDIDYDEKKLDLINRAKSRKNIRHENTQITAVNDENKQVIVEEKNKSKLPPLPRRY
ncbi:MAG TPA: hypothetical protein ENH85_15595 [Candidatus Scalindua sp.]|nr:hypothetical protein [Candidatus Scalindua sp.]